MTQAKLTRRRVLLLAALTAVIVVAVWLGVQFRYHVLPPLWSGEAARLAAALRVQPGDAVADIGAGRGRLATAMARHVSQGIVYATEIDPQRLQRLRSLDAANIQVIEGHPTQTGLDDGCCRAVYLRNVYHHLADPRAFNDGLRRALLRGGRIAIIDFGPGSMAGLDEPPPGAAPERTGHGVPAARVARELEAAGFTVERIDPKWGGGMYLVLARTQE